MSAADFPPYYKLGFIHADINDEHALVCGVAFQPQGDHLAVASYGQQGGIVRIYHTSNLALRRTYQLRPQPSALAWHPRSRHGALVVGDRAGDVTSMSLANAQVGPFLRLVLALITSLVTRSMTRLPTGMGGRYELWSFLVMRWR